MGRVVLPFDVREDGLRAVVAASSLAYSHPIFPPPSFLPMIDAFHLPALPDVPTTSRSYGEGEGAFELRVPRLTPELVREQARALAEARARGLERRPVAEIVAVIDRVA